MGFVFLNRVVHEFPSNGNKLLVIEARAAICGTTLACGPANDADTTGRLDSLTRLPDASVTLMVSGLLRLNTITVLLIPAGPTVLPSITPIRMLDTATVGAVEPLAMTAGAPTGTRGNTRARNLGNGVAADRDRIDDERPADRPVTALGKRGPRRVDRAGDPRGIAGHGHGLRVVARLEEHDPRIEPARRGLRLKVPLPPSEMLP